MNFDKLKDDLKEHGIKVGFMKKGLYRQLSDFIPEDAEIVAAGEGLDSKSANATPAIVTNNNVYLAKYPSVMSLPDVATIKRESITGCEVNGGLLATLTISTTSKDYQIERIPKPTAAKIASVLA
jgi:hypothetical protein